MREYQEAFLFNELREYLGTMRGQWGKKSGGTRRWKNGVKQQEKNSKNRRNLAKTGQNQQKWKRK